MTELNNLLKPVQLLAARFGVAMRPHVPAADQEAFFRAIQPVETEHPLVRIGGAGDGGYLVPDDLDGVVACFSPGVSETVSFEEELLERGLRTFQIDASIADTPLKHPNNAFARKFLGIVSDDKTITLDDWVRESVGDTPGDLMLQMDIEGHEWLTLAQVSDETLARFRIIVLELHGLDRVFESFGATVLTPVLERLRRHFDIIHLHANNVVPVMRGRRHAVAPLVEATLLRRDRSNRRAPLARLPHPLDRDNLPDRAPVALPRSMYDFSAVPAAPAARAN
jgi:hypothetical protein